MARALSVEIADHIATVTLLGPGKGNAMGPDLWRELPEAFAALDADASVRVVVLRGSGDHFTYGLDLMAMAGELGPHLAQATTAGPRTELLGIIRRLQGAVNAVERCRKPVIAAIHGWCIGGGIDLVTACDVRMCSAEARFSVREVRVAMVADLGTHQRLPRVIGQGHARELALTGRDIDAAYAERIGLVNHVHPSPEALFEAAHGVAREIVDNPPLVVQGIKQVMNFSADHPTSDGLAYVALWNSAFLASDDLTEAMTAFAMKRPPSFKGS